MNVVGSCCHLPLKKVPQFPPQRRGVCDHYVPSLSRSLDDELWDRRVLHVKWEVLMFCCGNERGGSRESIELRRASFYRDGEPAFEVFVR